MGEKKITLQDVAEENRKIRMLRLMVDLSLSLILQKQLTSEEALEQFARVKRFALKLFPGKEEAFELIYAPKFKRAIAETYGFH